MNISDFFTTEFLQRAILGGSLVAIVCSILSPFVILRKQAYLADGVAHASLAGVALALVIAGQPLVLALLVAVAMSVLITYIQKSGKNYSDTVIGIVYALLFAIGILLLNTSNSYKPEISTYLFGSLLAISWNDILIIFIFTLLLCIFLITKYKNILYSTVDKTAAYLKGINVNLMDYIINICISLSVVLAVKSVGIILVTSLLLIPGSVARLFARSFKHMIFISILANLVILFVGITLAFYLNVPPGATIVITGAITYLVLVIFKSK